MVATVPREPEDEAWRYQLRLTVSEALAGALRGDHAASVHPPLGDVLRRFRATLVCQLDAFAGYVREAEQNGRTVIRFTGGRARRSGTRTSRRVICGRSRCMSAASRSIRADVADALESGVAQTGRARRHHGRHEIRHESGQQSAAAGAVTRRKPLCANSRCAQQSFINVYPPIRRMRRRLARALRIPSLPFVHLAVRRA
ncbi:hypothetical protein [Paraburkholderia caballeronis]|uniref:hypothetical protein n=1 Tax=Paraburkholderia caballeronis TaxID=416943 RepID=UPI0031399975